jgi:hypothetical protein
MALEQLSSLLCGMMDRGQNTLRFEKMMKKRSGRYSINLPEWLTKYLSAQPLDAKFPDEVTARAGTALSAGCDS